MINISMQGEVQMSGKEGSFNLSRLTKGLDGRGIQSIATKDGQLIITLTDGTVQKFALSDISMDYSKLANLPSINGVKLEGDKSFNELGEDTITNSEIKAIIDKMYSAIFTD